MTVALIEKDKVGGTCLHRGCIPTKALLHAGRGRRPGPRERAVRRQGHASTASTCPASTRTRTGVVAALYKGLQGLVKAARRSPIVEGEGRLAVPDDASRWAARRYEGRHVVLATGSYAALAARPRHRRRAGHHQRPRADARPRARLGDRPRRRRHRRRVRQRLEVLRRRGHHRRGAAAPACRSRTSRSSKLLERAFRRRGIKFELGIRFEGVKNTDDRRAVVTLENGKTFEAELLLVAVGRGPVTAGPRATRRPGVAMDRGFVLVDELLPHQRARRLRGRRPDPHACSSPTSASPRASWSPSRSPASTPRRSTTPASRASPTPTPRSPRSASPRRRPRSSSARDRRR